MRLSTAIREGAKLRPPTTEWYAIHRSGHVYTCALGAAFEAITGKLPPDFDDAGDVDIPDLVESAIKPLLGGRNPHVDAPTGINTRGIVPTVFSVVVRLNDYYWTREAIADWLSEQGY